MLFSDVIAGRRHQPGDQIIDLLIRARDTDDRLTEEELVAFCVLLLFAGHETTAHFLSNSLRALLLNPAQLADFCENAHDPHICA